MTDRYRPPAEFPGYGSCADCGRGTMMCSEDDRWCVQCYAARGQSPPSTNDQPVRGLPNHPAPRATGQPARVALPSLPEGGMAVVQVAYPILTGGTLPMMAGKIIPHPTHQRIFYHAFSQTGAGGQGHDLTKCPCPIDTIVLDWLKSIGVGWVYVYDRDDQILYKAAVENIEGAPAMEYATRTIRTRRFLPYTDWLTQVGVLERHKGKDTRLVRAAVQGQGEVLIMTVPYVPESATVLLQIPERW